MEIEQLTTTNEERIFLKLQIAKSHNKKLLFEIGMLQSEKDQLKFELSELQKVKNIQIKNEKASNKIKEENKVFREIISTLVSKNNSNLVIDDIDSIIDQSILRINAKKLRK